MGSHVNFDAGRHRLQAGQTLWAGPADDGQAGLAWDWVQVAQGVLALADPLSVISNLRLVGARGEVLTTLQAACFLNRIVHSLPWQDEVTRALELPH